MATQPQRKPVTIYNHFTGETLTLDDTYFENQREAMREFLAHPRTDEELARLRRQYPDQAWAYTREVDDELRAAEERILHGPHQPMHLSGEEFLELLKDTDVPMMC